MSILDEVVEKAGDFNNEVAGTGMKVSDLYWILNLAVTGFEIRKKEFKSQPGGVGACEMASLASWNYDMNKLKELLIKESLKPKPKEKR